MTEWNYDWKKASLTLLVLVLGSCFIFGINSAGVKNPAWDNFGMYVVPTLFVISFTPFPIQKLITKWRNKK